MGDVFASFRDDPELRVAILTSTGEKFFCPGWDLKAAAAWRTPGCRTMVLVASAACRN